MRNCKRCESEMMQRSNGRWRCRSCDNAYQRARYREDPELIRQRKRDHMQRARQDPAVRERWNASRREAWDEKYGPQQRKYIQGLKERHFFQYRARLAGGGVSALDLARLWKGQRGRCALSGTKLGRDAHLDHITPRSKGGATTPCNVRWLDPWVNVALQDLTDGDFRDRCEQVAEWIGRRIMEAAGCVRLDPEEDGS